MPSNYYFTQIRLDHRPAASSLPAFFLLPCALIKEQVEDEEGAPPCSCATANNLWLFPDARALAKWIRMMWLHARTMSTQNLNFIAKLPVTGRSEEVRSSTNDKKRPTRQAISGRYEIPPLVHWLQRGRRRRRKRDDPRIPDRLQIIVASSASFFGGGWGQYTLNQLYLSVCLSVYAQLPVYLLIVLILEIIQISS